MKRNLFRLTLGLAAMAVILVGLESQADASVAVAAAVGTTAAIRTCHSCLRVKLLRRRSDLL